MSERKAENFLAPYEAACRAVSTLIGAKEIRAKAIAMKVYARQAKNKQLEDEAHLVRCIAERRLGEIIEMQKKTVGLNTGAKGSKVSGVKRTPVKDTRPTLADAEIDKNLAKQARAMAAIPAKEFDELKAKRRPKQIEHAAKRITRKARHQDIAAKAKLIAFEDRRFNLIYADPPWVFETFAESGQARTAEKHYPTMTDAEIADFKYGDRAVRDIVATDAILFMWCTPANMMRALAILPAWGFVYKTHLVWVKDKAGTGLYARQQHEPLLICTRGSPPRPVFAPSSVIQAPRGRHSEKPAEARRIIEAMYPHWDAENRIEFFSRDPANGWTVYGYEAQ